MAGVITDRLLVHGNVNGSWYVRNRRWATFPNGRRTLDAWTVAGPFDTWGHAMQVANDLAVPARPSVL